MALGSGISDRWCWWLAYNWFQGLTQDWLSSTWKDVLFSLSVALVPLFQVDSTKYYEACVSDACACDSGGDCECFCTAVAAYAQACHDVGVCVSWRTPDICREWSSVRGAER
jgi:hypothetical protein